MNPPDYNNPVKDVCSVYISQSELNLFTCFNDFGMSVTCSRYDRCIMSTTDKTKTPDWIQGSSYFSWIVNSFSVQSSGMSYK